jgi:hypothetical protein
METVASANPNPPVPAGTEEAARLRLRILELEAELARGAADLRIIEDEVQSFAAEYERRFGRLLAELEELDAQITELLALRRRDDTQAQAAAREARARADDAAGRRAEVDRDRYDPPPPPNDDLKALYRRLASMVHPDRAQGEEDRAIRTDFMAEVNAAYQARDLRRLQDLDRRWAARRDPGERSEPSSLDELRARVAALQLECEQTAAKRRALEASESYRLFQWVRNSSDDRESMFIAIESDLREQVAQRQKELEKLSTERPIQVARRE